MKKLILFLFIAVVTVTSTFAQAPQKFTYQAVVRDAGNNPVANHSVSVRLSILQGDANGVAVYVETQAVTTNANGLMSLSVGDGTVVGGSIAAIDWSNGPYFLKTETDPTGGTNYTIVGSQQLLSVPYALYAGNSTGGFSGDYNDLINTPQIPEIPENISYFQNDAGYITMDSIPQIPENVSAFTNDAGYLTSSDCGNVDFCSLVTTLAELQAQVEALQHAVDSLSGLGGGIGGGTTGQDAQPCPGTPTLTDVDGNVYNTVQIGQQCWMKENLRTTRYADHTEIPAGSTTSDTDPYRYAPNNDEGNVPAYGYLYNWPAVMHGWASSSINPSGVQGICPTGWHVPSNAEWTQLTDYVSSQSQYVCGSDNTYIAKALASTTGWNSSTTTCAVGNTLSSNNATGFSALPAGNYNGTYYASFGYNAGIWSATEYDGGGAYGRNLYYDGAGVGRINYGKYLGFSVRCLRD